MSYKNIAKTAFQFNAVLNFIITAAPPCEFLIFKISYITLKVETSLVSSYLNPYSFYKTAKRTYKHTEKNNLSYFGQSAKNGLGKEMQRPNVFIKKAASRFQALHKVLI